MTRRRTTVCQGGFFHDHRRAASCGPDLRWSRALAGVRIAGDSQRWTAGTTDPREALPEIVPGDAAAPGHLLLGCLSSGGSAGAQSAASGRTVLLVVLEPPPQGGEPRS